MAMRPWHQPQRMFAIKIGGRLSTDKSTSSIGWAVLRLDNGLEREGEHRFDEPLTPERAATEAVMSFRREMAGTPFEDWPEIDLYRYTKAAWPQSVAAAEGGTHEQHDACVRAVARALRAEGAVVHVKKVFSTR